MKEIEIEMSRERAFLGRIKIKQTQDRILKGTHELKAGKNNKKEPKLVKKKKKGKEI